MGKTQIEKKLKELIESWYAPGNWTGKANIFFEIVDWFEYLRKQGYESDSMVVLSNIIVMG